MKALLRSIIVVGPGDRRDLLLRNYLDLVNSGLEFEAAADNALWGFIQRFVETHGHVPDFSTLTTHFKHAREDIVIDRLEELRTLKARDQGDFKVRLETLAEEHRIRVVSDLLSKAALITSTGLDVPLAPGAKETKHAKGPVAALRYLFDWSHQVVTPTLGTRLSGEVTSDGQDFLEGYARVEADPLAGVGQHTGLEQIDTVTGGAHRQELWIHAAYTGGLKCVAGDTTIFDVDRGELRTAKEIFESGDAPRVHALDGEIKTSQASPLVENGVRTVYRVTTDTGHTIRVSGNHPFLTPEGWEDAQGLVPGGWVALADALPAAGKEEMSDAEIKVIGYLLGDGRVKDDITLTNASGRLIDDFKGCLDEMGLCEKGEGRSRGPSYSVAASRLCKSDCRKKTQMVRVSRSTGRGLGSPWVSPMRSLLDRLGLYGCGSRDKFIPSVLWGCSERQLWVLLSALWATDGRLGVEKGKGGRQDRPVVWFAGTSEGLVRGVHLLLQRLGVPSVLSPGERTYRGRPYPTWHVRVSKEGMGEFLDMINPVGKEVALRKARAAFNHRTGRGGRVPTVFLKDLPEGCRVRTSTGWYYAHFARTRESISWEVAQRFASHPDCDESTARVLLSKGVVWARVAEVVPDGEEMVYDLSVPGPKNFVANGFITHNSTFALNWAYNQSVYFRHNSCVFSLEMPYEQCRRVLYAIHSSHGKFKKIRHRLGLQKDPGATIGLPYEHLKHGTLKEWHPNARDFLYDYVVPDFNDPKNKYGKIHIEVADPEKPDFKVSDLRQRAELIYSESPFRTIYADHMGLMAPRKWVASTTDRLNEVIRDLKLLSMGFRRGLGIAVVGLFQIGRRGFQEAKKSKEKVGVALYNLTHLAYANQAEQSADIVTASYVDEELEKMNRAQFQCMKNRDGKKFEPFYARVEWPCRRILQCYDVPVVTGSEGASKGKQDQKAIDETADRILGDD